ncbi:amidohydrolase family protein [Siccirubricoccus sp. G192]|uniref:amidohydrolase family protein n=1 Tax=Siccirubricoccus sp. G192 TaxID=2849651 RepID=UPI001C2C7213|nr:amidohydrolase family protein [Siccirubricoccus sp. G192]MBV1798470.1 amidohydrolase family protein [Siccirubricoccus sp. G192]
MTATPRLPVPPGACDTHMHVYGPAARYLLAATAAKPPPAGADLAAYRQVMVRLGLERVVVVQPSAYGADNACTMDAVAALGEAGRAVVVVTPTTPEAEIARLHALGARGARFYLMQGAPQGWEALAPVAARIAPFGWHAQLQFDGTELPAREAMIRALPCPVVIDHIGRFHDPVPVDRPQVRALLRLLEGGRAWMKASAPYNTSLSGPPDYADVAAIARAAIRTAPDRVVWASNWPHPNRPAYPLEEAALLDLLGEWAPDEATRRRILAENPATLYGWSKATGAG